MNLKELKEHIRIERSQGETIESVTNELIEHGVSSEEISKAFGELEQEARRIDQDNKLELSKELPGAADIIRRGWLLARTHAVALAPIAAILALINVALNWYDKKYLVEERVITLVASWFGQGSALTQNELTSLAIPLVWMILGWLFVIWCIITVLVIFRDAQERLSVTEAFGRAGLLYWRYLTTSILSSLVVSLGVLVLIVPGVIFAGWFLFAPLIVLEGETFGGHALGASKKLVVGRWWAIMKRFLIIEALVLLLALPFSFYASKIYEGNIGLAVFGLVSAYIVFLFEILGLASFFVLFQAVRVKQSE